MENAPSKRGFTLVELLIVMAILAVLTLGVYFAIGRSTRAADNEKVMADLTAIQTALEQYKKDNGSYPTFPDPIELANDKNISCFDVDSHYEHDCTQAAFLQTQVDTLLLTKRYLSEIPTDPRTGTRYAYGVTTDGQFYQLAGNIQNADESWEARSLGNLDQGSPHTSLIRAFDGPNFIVDSQANLPYSNDPLNLTGRLGGLTGTVQVNDQPISEGHVVRAQDMIKVSPDATAVLYLSDGSVVHLEPNSTLQMLSTTEVSQNDEQGIGTKVRLKLFEGELWAKVVNLSDQSQFNIETTGAIAGVRGTEFGLNANLQTIDILSGEVGVRLKTEQEKADSNGEGQYLSFDIETFADNQFAKGDNKTITRYNIPSPDQSLQAPLTLTPAQVTEILNRYYQADGTLTLNDQPVVIKAYTPGAGQYEIDVAMNGLQGNDELKIQSFELFTEDQTDDIEILKEGAIPALTLPAEFDDQKQVYRFTLDYTPGSLFEDESGDMMSFVIRATNTTEGKTLYSGISWPLIGFGTLGEVDKTYEFGYIYQDLEQVSDALVSLELIPDNDRMIAGSSVQVQAFATDENDQVIDVTQDCKWSNTDDKGQMLEDQKGVYLANDEVPFGAGLITCLYKDFEQTVEIDIVSKLKGACFGPDLLNGGGDDAGYWDNDAERCWVLGDLGVSCDVACNSIGAICEDGTNPGGTNWDDNNSQICVALTGGDVQPAAFHEFAPFFNPGTNRCFARSDEIVEFTPNLCGTTKNIDEVKNRRICQCL